MSFGGGIAAAEEMLWQDVLEYADISMKNEILRDRVNLAIVTNPHLKASDQSKLWKALTYSDDDMNEAQRRLKALEKKKMKQNKNGGDG